MAIPVIDLFAGPGGLGEGFASVLHEKDRVFKIVLSIERDEFAHKTLTLRSFLRQFSYGKFPKEYYDFLESKERDIEVLYQKYPKQAAIAKDEAWRFELGDSKNHSAIDSKIKNALRDNENFVLIGGPPCQAYSLAGRSRRQEKKGLNREDERVYLYREYYRILGVHKPPVFMLENVKGLLSSKVDNDFVFQQLIHDLQNPVESYRKLKGEDDLAKAKIGYKIYSLVTPLTYKNISNGEPSFNPKDFIIRAEEYGIPQTRHRVILLGIRNDIDIIPETLKRKDRQIVIDEVLSGLPNLRSGLSKEEDGKDKWKEVLMSIKEIGLKDEIDFLVWEKIENTVEGLSLPQKDRGADFIAYNFKIDYFKKWFLDPNLKGVLNHQTKGHIKEDLFRYLFVSCFGKIYKRSPKLKEFPSTLLPKHKNIKEGIKKNKYADRFRVQVSGQPAKTITSHISKDGHYYIHPDPAQCRSLTVREAARIQTFPDNYYFCGPRTQQFHQVGNAVPPLLAKQIAEIVNDIFCNIKKPK